MRDFRELRVWEKAHRLALDVYQATTSFPREEAYGLTSQLRRAAVSIPANIAEGCGSNSPIDFARFLQIAVRSASELEYELLLAHDLGMLDAQCHAQRTVQVTEVKRMLTAFIQTLRADG
jgi:four helix bundle protein